MTLAVERGGGERRLQWDVERASSEQHHQLYLQPRSPEPRDSEAPWLLPGGQLSFWGGQLSCRPCYQGCCHLAARLSFPGKLSSQTLQQDFKRVTTM